MKLLLLFLVGMAFGVDKVTIPYDFDTLSTGKKGYLADNFEEQADKFNNSIRWIFF